MERFKCNHFSRNMKRRRDCRIYSKSDLLTAFENANTRIISKFKDSSSNLCTEGIRHLRQITSQYLGQQTNHIAEFPTFQIPQDTFALQRPDLLMMKKPILEQKDSSENIFRGVTFSQSQEEEGRENTCRFGVFPSENKQLNYETAVMNRVIDSTTKKLSQSFKKMGIDQRFYNDDEDEDTGENTNNLNMPNFEGKSIIQIMEESNRKVEARILEREQRPQEFDSDSSYPLTDYSSNNSSNDNDYQQEFRSSFKGKEESITSSQSYKPSNILYSPKKSKSQAKQKKRLYIRQKKIPSWAQDLQKVNQTVIAQSHDQNFDPDIIYGSCVVELLNTNVIFNSQGKVYRGSSAKWNRNPFNQFIT